MGSGEDVKIERNRSLFMFEEDNKIRKGLKWMVKSNWFDYFIIIMICLSSI